MGLTIGKAPDHSEAALSVLSSSVELRDSAPSPSSPPTIAPSPPMGTVFWLEKNGEWSDETMWVGSHGKDTFSAARVDVCSEEGSTVTVSEPVWTRASEIQVCKKSWLVVPVGSELCVGSKCGAPPSPPPPLPPHSLTIFITHEGYGLYKTAPIDDLGHSIPKALAACAALAPNGKPERTPRLTRQIG